MTLMSRIGLGSATFGLDYGVTNAAGKVAPAMVADILALADTMGIRMIDTAADYGQSEAVIGERRPAAAAFSIVTKVGMGPGARAEDINTVFQRSLTRLRTGSVHGLLLHRSADLLGPEGAAVYQQLAALKDTGSVRKIGFSAYTVDETEAVLARFDVDIVQLPMSVVDQRFPASGMLSAMKRRGIEIHARSLFLQGLLLATPDALPAYFLPLRQRLMALRAALAANGISALEGCLLFGAQNPDVDFMVLGIASAEQLAEMCAAAERVDSRAFDFSPYALHDEKILNPSLWPANARLGTPANEEKNAVR